MASSSDSLSTSSRVAAAALTLALGAFAQEPVPPDPVPPDHGTPDHGTSGLGGDMQRPASEAALFRTFAKLKGLSADYTEEKHLSLLAVPLKSSGTLHYLQPGYLSRLVEKPEKSKLTITEAELRMAGKDGVEVIDLRQSDRVRLFVTSLLHVFRGDREALKKHYRVRYTPHTDDPKGWTLSLQPEREPLTYILKKLELRGRGRGVTTIELVEPNGDRTVTTITKARVDREFTAKEKQELFGIAPKHAEAPAARGK